MEPIEKITVNRRGDPFDGLLSTKVTDIQLLDAEAKWSPARIEIKRLLIEFGLPAFDVFEHGHWDWARKLRFSIEERKVVGDELFRSLGIYAEDTWQGLAMAEATIQTRNFSNMQKDPLVYIFFVETAPWNLSIPQIDQTPLFSGIGSALIATSVRFSIAKGAEGRVGLHALDQARGFYKSRGFVDFGPDEEHEGLNYMELPPEKAVELIKRIYGSRS